MADLPYVNAPGYIGKAIEKIKVAAVPPKFTQDFLSTKLSITSSSARALIPFFKAIRLLDIGSSPTDAYKRLRNSSQSGYVIAELMRDAYKPLYDINEYIHEKGRQELMGVIAQATGWEHDNQRTSAVAGSFEALKALADFDGHSDIEQNDIRIPNSIPVPEDTFSNRRLNIAYTINLNLPETTNPEVFDAIFSSLKRNILDD